MFVGNTPTQAYCPCAVGKTSKPVVEAYLFVLGKTINEVNFKRQVICTQHWPKGVRKNLEDPPSIKYTNVQGKETKEGREHWNCAAALCTNSWRTKLEGLQYYRLSDFAQCKDKQHAYNKVLMNKAVDFKRDFICSVHWSKGFRNNLDDLPDRACHPDYVNKQTTKKVTPQSKIASAKRSLSTTKQTNTKRRKLIRSSCSLDFNSDESKFDIMQKELQELKEKLENKTEEANRLSLQDTVLFGDCTENWISSPENYDLCVIGKGSGFYFNQKLLPPSAHSIRTGSKSPIRRIWVLLGRDWVFISTKNCCHPVLTPSGLAPNLLSEGCLKYPH
ncbi:hypothetical protein pdam_00008092 [Pocillopora damicornis]|uniref:Uncharacterized protein n=1 Tax=Pocillopora damicornis TaxID=46731 RepID=A0A3M6UDF1_POCDA|nr:hypothetical protein pdam_00008092 [Pocillopora damicornis]